jgi:hypothetical protein
MFLRTYAKWIDGGQNALEMKCLEDALKRSYPWFIPTKAADRLIG